MQHSPPLTGAVPARALAVWCRAHLLVVSEVGLNLHEALHGVRLLGLGEGAAKAQVGRLSQVHQQSGGGV